MKSECIEVEDIELHPEVLSATVDMCILQLRSPFWDEMYSDEIGGKKIFSMLKGQPHDYYERRVRNIRSLLGDIRKLSNVDILIFPEYSLDEGMIEAIELKKFSQEVNAIVIGNYYDKNDRESTTFIITPNPEMKEPDFYEEIKQHASKYDAEYLTPYDKIPDSKKKILRFWWNTKINDKEERAFLQIFTCKDFSIYGRSDISDKDGKKIIDTEDNGIIIVPSCTPGGIDEWRSKAMDLLRDGESNKKTIITLFSNSIDLPTQQGLDICGESQVVTVIEDDKKETKIEGKEEGIILCTLNPFSLVFKVSPKGGPNKILINSIVKGMNEDGKIIEKEKDYKTAKLGMVVNPMAFERLNLSLIYMLFGLEDYYTHKNALEKASMGLHGIFGVHDVLCKSFEEEGDIIDKNSYIFLRLMETELPNDEILTPYFMKIKRRVKYHGTSLYKIDANGELIPKYPIPTAIEVKGYLSDIKKVLNSDENVKENKEELLRNKICVEVEEGMEESDISEREKKSEERNVEEFLVLVHISRNGTLFQKYLLPELIENDKIRTIEAVAESTKGNIQGYEVETHWILHIVGTIDDLRKSIIEIIHKKSNEYGIEMGTRLVLPAERISKNTFPALSETTLLTSEDRNIIRNYISFFCEHRESGYKNPFAVKNLDDDTVKKVIEIYRDSENFIENYEYLAEKQKRMRVRINEFVFGIARTLTKDKNDLERGEEESEDLKMFKDYCKGFFSDITEMVEKISCETTRKVAKEVGEDNFFRLINEQVKISERRKNHQRVFAKKDINKSVLGDHIQMISFWNGVWKNKEELSKNIELKAIIDKIEEKGDYSIPNEIIKDIKKIQREQFTEIRDWFTHVDYKGGFKVSDKSGIIKIFDDALYGLSFLLRYRYQQKFVGS